MKKEKNQLLEAAKQSIPYIKELKKLPTIKSTNACILMQQIEYWMHIKPKGFYKFLSIPSSIQYAYKPGDSWTEELGISEDEFRTAFKQIGTSYGSKKEYNSALLDGDIFEGKFYCCYFDKISRLTHYFRNDSIVNEAIRSLYNSENSDSERDKIHLGKTSKPSPKDGNVGFIEPEIADSESTENTSDNTHDITLEREALSSNNKTLDMDYSSEQGRNVSEELSVINVSEISTSNSDKALIPEDFEPSLEELFRAAVTFPTKSPSFVTEKFIKCFRSQNKKLTMTEWHLEWWNWMNTEKPSHGNELLEDELFEIKKEVLNPLLGEICDVDNSVFDAEYLFTNQQGNLSEKTIRIGLDELVQSRHLYNYKGYYFDLHRFGEDEEFRESVFKEYRMMDETPPESLRDYFVNQHKV